MLRWLWTETRITSRVNQTYKKRHLGNPILGGTDPLARPFGGTNNQSAWLRTRRGTPTSWTWREQRPVDMVALLGLMLRQNITEQRLIKLIRKPPHPREYRLRGTQIPAHQLGGETRARKLSWRQGFHFIRDIKQKMNNYTAGRRRAETLFLHQNGHRKHRLYTGTWATSPDGAGQLPAQMAGTPKVQRKNS